MNRIKRSSNDGCSRVDVEPHRVKGRDALRQYTTCASSRPPAPDTTTRRDMQAIQ